MATNVEPFYVALGRRIFRARVQAGMTQAQLAERLSRPLTRAAIANIETGKQRVLAHTLVEISRVIGMRLDDLVPQTTPATKTDLERKLLSFNVPEEVARALAAEASDDPATRRTKR